MLGDTQWGGPEKIQQRAAGHLLAHLACLGPHTITGLIAAMGGQLRDWSAEYRLYGHDRVDPEAIFATVRREIMREQEGEVVVALDDTHVRKSGTKIHGVKYRRDPLGPPFQTNLIRAQRFVQMSMASHEPGGATRMIPVDWMHAPTPIKPRRNADAATMEAYHRQQAQSRLGLVAAQRVQALHKALQDEQPNPRPLWLVVDGGYTNRTFLANLPPQATVIGRIRKDAKLHFLPTEQTPKGRNRAYGEDAPTPEALLRDEATTWETTHATIGGQPREIRFKQLRSLRWRPTGQQTTIQLLVLAPTLYRLSKNSPVNHRQPLYLICTDPQADPQTIIQRYIWRWDIEVNFRDEKTLLGVGQAQVRSAPAVQNTTALAVTAYAMLLCANLRCHRNQINPNRILTPKWQTTHPHRISTNKLLQNLRNELLGQAIHFSPFATQPPTHTKPQKCIPNILNNLPYATICT